MARVYFNDASPIEELGHGEDSLDWLSEIKEGFKELRNSEGNS